MPKPASGRQRDLAKEMASNGNARYRKLLGMARKLKRESLTPVGSKLFQHAQAQMADRLSKWIKPDKVGLVSYAYIVLSRYDMKRATTLAVRKVCDSISFNQSFTSLAYQIGQEIDDDDRFARYLKDCKGRHHLRTIEMQRKQKLAIADRRRLLRQFSAEAGEQYNAASRKDLLVLGGLMIHLVEESTGLINIYTQPTRRPKHVRKMVRATEDCLRWLRESHSFYELLSPSFLPSTDIPLDRESHFDSPYPDDFFAAPASRRLGLVRADSKEQARALIGRDLDNVLEVTNHLQRVPFQVNKELFDVAKTFWANGASIAGLPSQTRVEIPPKPVTEDQEVLKNYRYVAARLFEQENVRRGRGIVAGKTILLGNKFQHDERIYFPHICDFRGRVYPMSTFLSVQGNDLSKAMLRFATGKTIDTPGAELWYRVHGANCFGIDKVALDERVDWTHANESDIIRSAADPYKHRFWAEADDPWQFLAWCQEYARWRRDPGLASRLVINMDGANNGLQIFSFLRRDPALALATNCLPCDSPNDVYQRVADAATVRLRNGAIPTAQQWLTFCNGALPRSACKRSVMTLPYGCTLIGCRTFIDEWYRETVLEGRFDPWSARDGFNACIQLSNLIWSCITEVVGAATETMSWLYSVVDTCADLKVLPQWTSPSGFPVVQAYKPSTYKTFATKYGEKSKLYISWKEPRDGLDRRKSKRGISPNFVHSIDAGILVRATQIALDAGVQNYAMVHDSYGTLAADAPIMAGAVRSAYAQVFSENLLEKFRQDILKLLPEGTTLPEPPSQGTMNPNDVLESLYFFA